MTRAAESSGGTGPVVAGAYFDGHTSRLYRVQLTVREDRAYLDGEAVRDCPLHQLRVAAASRHAVRKITFPDGAYLEVRDRAGLAQLLQETGHRDSWVVRWQQSWRQALVAAGASVLTLVLGYQYLLPLAAGWAAQAMPARLEQQLGAGVLDLLDRGMFLPSQLPQTRQQALVAAFRRLQPPERGGVDWRIVFRRSRVGPNAFALPSGEIVLTDEMVSLLQDDQAVLGVLAHELGHLQRRHMMRRMLQGAVVGAGAALLFGDASTLLSTLPAVVLDMKYSRDAEREADDYAVAMLQHNGIELAHLVRVFERLGQQEQAAGGQPVRAAYLSTHPASAERIARIRAVSARQP